MAGVLSLAACAPEYGPGQIGSGDDLELCVGEVEVPDPALRALLVELLPQPPGPGDCCEAHDDAGCANDEVQACVCEGVPACCDGPWTQACVDAVQGQGCAQCLAEGEEPPKVVLAEALRDLAGLRAPSLGIVDLTGLECAQNLRTVGLSGNAIVDVTPLLDLPLLTELQLSDNAVKDLRVVGKLSGLDLTPLRSATGMISLEASRNQLTALDGVEGMHVLDRLVAQENAVTTTAPVAGLGLLTVLDLGANEVESLAGVETLMNLRRLSMIDNRIASITAVTGLPELREIDVRRNPVRAIDAVATLPLFGTLQLGHDGVAVDLSPLAGLPVFRRLVYQGGRVDQLDVVATLPALESLELQDTAVSAAAVAGIAGATGLQSLFLDRSGVADLSSLAPLTQLERLRCEDCAVQSIAVFANWPSLVEVKLAGNPLQSLAGTETLEFLDDLDVARSAIDDLGPLVENETFRSADAVDARETGLSTDDCGAIAAIVARKAVVEHDVACP
ncbi:MAG: hypothetical protein IPK74_20355 [Deltaproteobacteria bacterium]|nr:hypothetical protein [Deltaproteobacteria bacterium]